MLHFFYGFRTLAPSEWCLCFTDLWILFRIPFPLQPSAPQVTALSWPCAFRLYILWALCPWPLLSVDERIMDQTRHLSFCLTCERQADKTYTFRTSASGWLKGKSYNTRAATIFAKDNNITVTILIEVKTDRSHRLVRFCP